MKKQVRIAVKPHNRKHAIDADTWVEQRASPAAPPREPKKRLTIDIPLSVHTQFKVWCAQRGREMADELRELIHHRLSERP